MEYILYTNSGIEDFGSNYFLDGDSKARPNNPSEFWCLFNALLNLGSIKKRKVSAKFSIYIFIELGIWYSYSKKLWLLKMILCMVENWYPIKSSS